MLIEVVYWVVLQKNWWMKTNLVSLLYQSSSPRPQLIPYPTPGQREHDSFCDIKLVNVSRKRASAYSDSLDHAHESLWDNYQRAKGAKGKSIFPLPNWPDAEKGKALWLTIFCGSTMLYASIFPYPTRVHLLFKAASVASKRDKFELIPEEWDRKRSK